MCNSISVAFIWPTGSTSHDNLSKVLEFLARVIDFSNSFSPVTFFRFGPVTFSRLFTLKAEMSQRVGRARHQPGKWGINRT